MLEEVPALPVGALIAGKLRVVRALGIGGMGTVYEVEHELTRHRRALKLLHAELASSPQIVARFLREASAAGRIGSPHIVETFDAGRLESGEPYLVMEMLDGQSLGSILDEAGKLPEADAIDWIAQACDGAQAAHDAGIIHRDIKPDNLFIQRSGRVKLLDFGISKFDPVLTGEQRLTGDLTLGTPFYMAPEQTSKTSSVDSRADVYALGVVLYECVTGERPFSAETYPQLVVQIHLGDYTPASSISGTSALLDGIIARAMARNPADRFQRPAELAQALRDLAVATERRASQPKPAAPAQSPFETTRRAGDLTSLLERHKQPRPELAATERGPDAEVPVAAAAPVGAEPEPVRDAALEPARGRAGNEPTLVSASEPPAAPVAKKTSSGWKLAALAALLPAGAGLAWSWAATPPPASPAEPSASAASVAVPTAPSTGVDAPSEPTGAPSSSAHVATSTSLASTSGAAHVVPVPARKPAKPGSRAQEHELEQANPFQ